MYWVPHSILKLDIIVTRWDEKDPLIGTWHEPVQIFNMGVREQCFCFLNRMLQEHASFQNDSCDRLTCEFLSALTVVTGKLYWAHREGGIGESRHLQAKWRNSSYLHHRLQQGEPTWCRIKIQTTKRADSWGRGTGTENEQDVFVRDNVFGHSGQLSYSCKHLCSLPVCYIVR